MKKVFFITAILAVMMGAVWFIAKSNSSQPAIQPIAFNHKRHIEENMTCVDCHKGVEKQAHATLPSVKACMLCHKEPQGNHPDEPKVRAYAERGEPIPWIKVNRLPGHVYFSHAAHVTFAKMDCGECHGDMKNRTTPVTSSQIDNLSMNKCMECHKQKGVSTDCLRCHK